MRRIILASGSPRRQELMQSVGVQFVVDPSRASEEVDQTVAPVDLVKILAERKATEVAERYRDGLIIGADTLVALNNEIMGKPRDAADARRMLMLLSGKTHQVYTGVAVIDARSGDREVIAQCTDVTMRQISLEEVERYISSGEPMDKAGAYAIQGKASLFVTGINGCYFNVVGLPIQALNTILHKFGEDML